MDNNKINGIGGICAFGLLVSLTAAPLLAQPTVQLSGSGGKTIQVVRTEAAPTIDGVLDDSVWQNASFIDDFHQITPVEYAEPSERTEVYLLYDDDALYVAARLYISEEAMTARFLSRGSNVISDDNIVVNVGPFNDRRSGYYFAINPNGVLLDGMFQNVSQPYNDWDTIFYARAGRFEGGWTAEFEIPFKSLSFDPNSETWGLNFTRSIQSRNEMIGWQTYDRRYDPSSFGEMTGLRGLDQGVGLDIIPGASLRKERRFSPDGSETHFEPSLDIVYKLTPSLNGSLTINTDFSATEVDSRQVNLSRFSLFFPEKRDFFLRDSDIFEFGRIGSRGILGGGQNGRPFFSRNIGLGNSGQPVDLDYGAKVSGRAGNFDLGALSIRQEGHNNVEAQTLSVARASMGVLDESTMGFILTDGNPHSNLDNTLLGVDFLYRNVNLPGNRVLEVSSWYQQSETEGLSGDDSAAGIGFNMPNSTGFSGGAAIKRFEENFNPALGFVNRRGVRDVNTSLSYTHRFDIPYWQTYEFNIDARRYDYLDGGLQSQQITVDPYYLTTRSNDIMFWRSNFDKEVLLTPFEISEGIVIPAGEYSFYDHGIEFQTARHRKYSARFTYITGTFYNGDLDRYFGGMTWQPSPKFSADMSYDIRFVDLPQGDFITRLLSANIDYVFTNNLSWRNFIQYDNVSETLGINMRLHWVPEEGQEFFFVINQLMEDYDKNNNFRSEYSDATAKFSYTFRY